MSVRRSFVAALSATLAGASLALAAAPAHAATDVDDPTFVPVATDFIGVGSDTSQHALKLLSEAYNATSPAHKFASFAATSGGTITLPGGDINRPNGSGAGKALLYNPSNADIDFARSSSALSTAEVSAGLQAFPFALDTLKMAVSNNVPSHAPTSLTPAQIVSIYNGSVTNWSQLGGTDGVIAPKIPQAGSGTRSFFEAQLKAANGNVAVTLGQNVAEVQEHDDTAIKGDANAIAPFSVGRAGLLGTTLRLEGGFSADRALYNVVRGADLANTDVQAFFGVDGYVCSDNARTLIEQAGFKQLDSVADGGVCGQATQGATSNFKTNEAPDPIATTTKVTSTSTAVGKAKVVVTVSASSTPEGTVRLYDGQTLARADVPVIGGTATIDLSGLAPGAHTFSAGFVPAEGTAFVQSVGTVNAVVKAGSKVTEGLPAKVAKGKRASGTVTVAYAGITGAPAGKVVVKEGAKTLTTGTLKAGKVTLTLPKLKPGKHTVTISWAGDAKAVGSSVKTTLTQAKK